ncbi:MAG: hypothetical protein KAH99_01515 [Verrucomicrobia bacterium]|nr:hypothetical protein [Verrucomicrobiota bacterium]
MKKADILKIIAIVRGGLLCLMLLIGLAGCKSTKKSFGLSPERLDKTRAVIQSEIPDVERRQALLDGIAAYEVEVQAIFDETKALRAKIAEENRDYDTPREQLQELYDEIGVQLERLGDSVKTHSLKLRKLCSEAEWNRIFAHDDDAVIFKF